MRTLPRNCNVASPRCSDVLKKAAGDAGMAPCALWCSLRVIFLNTPRLCLTLLDVRQSTPSIGTDTSRPKANRLPCGPHTFYTSSSAESATPRPARPSHLFAVGLCEIEIRLFLYDRGCNRKNYPHCFRSCSNACPYRRRCKRVTFKFYRHTACPHHRTTAPPIRRQTCCRPGGWGLHTYQASTAETLRARALHDFHLAATVMKTKNSSRASWPHFMASPLLFILCVLYMGTAPFLPDAWLINSSKLSPLQTF
ncbi:unnamed protein product [Ectocarpus sp. 8 AP-2014]